MSTLAMRHFVAFDGYYPLPGDEGRATNTIGMVHLFAGLFQIPVARSADGSRVRVNLETAAAAVLGRDLSNAPEFALPDLRGRPATGRQGEATLQARGEAGALTALIATSGDPPEWGGFPFLGAVVFFGGGFAPVGWTPADGRMLAIADNPDLYEVLGDTYGGDGGTSFALPDLRGRAVIGAGQAPGLAPVALGEAVGGGNDGSVPALGLRYLIAMDGVFPSQHAREGFPVDQCLIAQVLAFAGKGPVKNCLPADGRKLRCNWEQGVFSLLGTTYGGDGRDYFALPDLRGRVPVGLSR